MAASEVQFLPTMRFVDFLRVKQKGKSVSTDENATVAVRPHFNNVGPPSIKNMWRTAKRQGHHSLSYRAYLRDMAQNGNPFMKTMAAEAMKRKRMGFHK